MGALEHFFFLSLPNLSTISSVESKGEMWTAVACNKGLSFFINIPDNAGPRLEPEHTLGELTHCTEIHHKGHKVKQRHEYGDQEDLHDSVCVCACERACLCGLFPIYLNFRHVLFVLFIHAIRTYSEEKVKHTRPSG